MKKILLLCTISTLFACCGPTAEEIARAQNEPPKEGRITVVLDTTVKGNNYQIFLLDSHEYLAFNRGGILKLN